jgi:2-polyprenyl-3-methyl-5-hydroxy-6-metoxy-1,4-benzoquinol methylase
VCGIETIIADCIEESDNKGARGTWYHCQCGVIFQSKQPEGAIYDEHYVAKLAEGKQARERYEYLLRLYAPLIEELTYGRMMLEVGFCVPYILQSMEERGWLTWAIDVNPTLTGKGNIYKGDFLDYDFSLSNESVKGATGEDKIDRKFDLVWMGHVLEHFSDPITALNKSYELLESKGILFITTPDIDFINKTTVQGWPHFRSQEHYILWSERALCRELERIGFNIIMKRRNFSARFMEHYDLHIMAQKAYF